MRYLGLDLGTKTLGVAISDKTNMISSSLKTIFYNNEDELILELKNIISEYKITKIILGFPKNMNNSLGKRGEATLKFKDKLEQVLKVEVELVDERLSTVEAESVLINADLSRKKRKKVIDSLAASIILDTYLRRINNGRK